MRVCAYCVASVLPPSSKIELHDCDARTFSWLLIGEVNRNHSMKPFQEIQQQNTYLQNVISLNSGAQLNPEGNRV